MSRVRWIKRNFPSCSSIGGCDEAVIPLYFDWVPAAGNLPFQTGLNSEADRCIDDPSICGRSHLFLFNGLRLV
jgi:hypothetical protein